MPNKSRDSPQNSKSAARIEIARSGLKRTIQLTARLKHTSQLPKDTKFKSCQQLLLQDFLSYLQSFSNFAFTLGRRHPIFAS